MRFTTIFPTLALAPASTNAFHVSSASNPTAITSTSLEARRLMVPMLRRRRAASSMFFPDVDRMFREMDEIMESSFSDISRPSSVISKYPQAQGLGLRQALGFDVTQDEKEFKVTMNLADVEVKDVDLQLDPDGRVLRLKGNKLQEDGGMKIQSSFEKAILLHPDVNTEKISASFDGGVLSIVAPKIVKDDVVEETKTKRIEIAVAETKSDEVKAVADGVGATAHEESPNAPTTRLAVETMKNERVVKKSKVAANKDAPEKKWPARDFPY
jgi:HSP20 family protein